MNRTAVARQWNSVVGLGFHLLYHQLSAAYDPVSWLVSFGRWRSWQMAALPFLRGRNVLEVAFGTGHMLQTMRRMGFNVTGVDRSPQMAHIAADRNPDVPLLTASAQNLPFRNRSFDSVLCTFPTDFILDHRSLGEIERLLRPNGRLVVIPEARLTGGSPFVRFIELLYRLTGQRPDKAVPPGVQHAGFALFTTAGFEMRLERVLLPGSEVMILVGEKGQDPMRH